MQGYKPSFYSETVEEHLTPDPFEAAQGADICIVGGGIAALSCAQALLQSGCSVVVFEAGRIFSGASGLNGGFVSPGYALAMGDIERKVGTKHTQRLFELSVGGVNTIDGNIENYAISSARQTAGKIVLLRYPPGKRELQFTREMHDKFNYEISPVDKDWLRSTLSSTIYEYGFLYKTGFHMHPLNYGIALARNLQKEGLAIVEGERVLTIRARESGFDVVSTSGESTFDHVIVCTGGYASGEVRKLQHSILPITTYVAVTEPDDALPGTHIKASHAFGDTRRASDYYRIVNGNQLLWGGRITAFPTRRIDRISEHVRDDILKSYPLIKSLKIKTAWSGIMGYAAHKMPYIGRMENGIWYCSAFGGHGLGPGTAGGRTVADAILGNNRNIDLFRPFRLRSTFGLLGRIAVEVTYKKYIITDHIREFRKSGTPTQSGS